MTKELEKYLTGKQKAEKDFFAQELGYVPENKDELNAAIDYINQENGMGQKYLEERIERCKKAEVRRYLESENGRAPSSYVGLTGDDFMQERIRRSQGGRDF